MKRKILMLISLTVCLTAFIWCSGCSAKTDLTNYVSEYRSEIYQGTEGEYSIFASYTEREYPYLADGYVGNMTKIFEIVLTAPDNTKTYTVQFTIGQKQYEAELSFDSVRMIHSCSQTIDLPEEKTITFTIAETESTQTEIVTVSATSVKSDDTLTLNALLEKVKSAEQSYFDTLTSGKNFAGELYVRLLFENQQCYYYIGIIDRAGNTYCILADALSGEILATRNQ